MTIYEQLIEVFGTSPGMTYSAAAIGKLLFDRFGTNPGSVIPSDYSYNRWNRGLTRSAWRPVFIRLSPGQYKYVGSGFLYDGLVLAKARDVDAEEIVGEWLCGQVRFFDPRVAPTNPPVENDSAPDDLESPQLAREVLPLSSFQIDRLYEEYLEVLELEVKVFGCKPTETRHVIGRIGELHCARLTRGTLATRVNQPGFDVVSGEGRRISVKTTAQSSGFVSISAKTWKRADDLMVIQYVSGDFRVLYHGRISLAVEAARPWKETFELDLTVAHRLAGSGATNT